MNTVLLNSNTKKGRTIRRILSYLLVVAILATSLSLEAFSKKAEASGGYVTLYLKDDTEQHWLGNNNAVMELVDNTYGHDRYIMTKVNSTTWSCKVPASTYNVTFNRLSPDKSTQWNSWSAGGRDGHSTYHATVPEHGYWDGTAVVDNEYFHEGDIIYLDFYSFLNWEQTSAVFYVNFTNYAKSDNNGEDIDISSADRTKVSPILLTDEIETQVFKYVVTAEDEGATSLRFFRGNSTTLWNNSVVMNYSDYKAGNNCVKVQGWNDMGYVCPYVPRRHITQIDSMSLEISGNRKVNRKIDIDLNITGETELLSQEDTVISIVKIDSSGNAVEAEEGQVFFLLDDTVTAWNHRELIFKQAGTYKICAVATDGYDDFPAETTIAVVEDAAPQAVFDIGCGEGESTAEQRVYVRNSEGTAHISVTDASVSELGDEIKERTYLLYQDSNNDGEFNEDEIIAASEENQMQVSYTLDTPGRYRVVLNIKETFTDTIPSLIDDSVYLRGSCVQDFEITNQAPVSAMYVEKSKLSDIIFTVGNADSERLSNYAEVTAGVKEKLAELGIEANVSTVSTSALTAQDTFAWTEYDHYNYADRYLPTLEKHIIYDGNDIKMVGYSREPLKDFLYVADNDPSRKVFEFDLQRDNNNWHSMEGGGFLFNTIIDEDENYMQGYCILVTQYGLKLVQINKVNLTDFRNGRYRNVQNAGSLLRTYGMTNLLDNHHFKVIVDKNVLTVYDDDRLVIDEYVLPDDGVEAYGYGPIISHESHSCSQQSYFTFKNIVMQTITGESLSDVVNNHEWTPGTNHYVINLSETSVPELSDADRMADVAASLLSKDAMFFGIGNENTIDQYNSLVNAIDQRGENISLTYSANEEENSGDSAKTGEKDSEGEDADEITVETAVDQILARIIADIESKDYSIGYTITTDEKVTYKDTYYDPEGDEAGAEVWEYIHDASVFGEEHTEPENIQRSEPITMFTDAGAYTVTHRVSDNPTKGNAALYDYIRWADTDEYQKLILAQNRPTAYVTVTTTQKPSDSSRCMVNVIYESTDPDHPSDDRKGIREEKFYYREMSEQEWTEGRFPTEAAMGTTYLIKYEVKDIEGTWSCPAVVAVRTSEAREYVRPDDTTPPECSITVSKEIVELGETLYIEAVAADDYGVTGISLKVNGKEIATQPGRYSYVPDEAGNLEITLTATDICDNEGTAAKSVRVVDKSDVTPPTITITSPKNGTVTGNVDIIGSITDDKALASYRVVQSRAAIEEQEEEGQTGGQEEIVLAEGTEEITDGKIATVETTPLESGVYKIEITATDKAGLSSSVYMLLTVEKTEAGDRIPPTAVISDISLDNDNQLIEITGTVSDEIELKNYTLKVYKKNSAGNDIEEILSVTGNQAKSEEILGTISTQELLSGEYSVILTVEDSAGNQTTAKAGFTYTAGTGGDDISRSSDTEPPVIITELNAEIKDESLKINLRGTIADESGLVYTVTLGKKQSDGSISGALIIAAGDEGINDAEIASYSLKPFETGDYVLIIEAEDEFGNLRKTEFTITVTPNGTVDEGYGGETGGGDDGEETGQLNLVLGKTTVSAGESVTAYLTYPDTAENVKLILKNKKTEQESGIAIHGRTAEVTAASYGEYKVILSADINGEKKEISADLWFLDAEDDTHPVAEFAAPESESIVKSITDITGTVSDDKELKYYTLEYKQEGTDDYIELSRGTEPVINGKLGTLDTTRLLNGRYVLRLTAVDMAGHRIRTERYINVEGNLKVGNMSIGFTDITSNVAGIPLSLTRNYDSRNKASGDFGTGWSMGLMDVRLKEASDICMGYHMTQVGKQLSTSYYITQTSCHDITVTYGDGTSDRFELILSPERQALVPISQVTVSFRCVTNPKVKLAVNRGGTAMFYGDGLWFEAYDILESPSYILTREDGTKLYLDEQHGLLSMEDTNGNMVSVTNAGFKHSDGNGITFTRDADNRITKAEETDKSGNVINKTEYAYDSHDNLISVTDNAGRTVGYTYDADHNLIDIIDPSGIAVARNIYDEDGRLVAIIDSDGNKLEYAYDIEGRMESVKDRRGNITVYIYDENGNILQTIDALGNKTINTYDENNNCLSTIDANGNITSYEYNDKGNLTEVIAADGTKTISSYTELNLVSSINTIDKTIIAFEYDNYGRMTSTVDANNNEVNYSYTSNGRLAGITDEIGIFQKITYDENGNPITSTNGAGETVMYNYDDNGNCISVTTNRENGDEILTFTSYYTYDAAGNITQSIDASGNITTYEYDVNDNQTASTDAKGRKVKYNYDNKGNLTSVVYSDGTMEKFIYDANGNNIYAIDRNGVTVNMTYDKLNRMVEKNYADGTCENYYYDAVGNLVKVVNVNGGEIIYEYDNRNRNTSITDALGNKTSFEYDEHSRLKSRTDAKGNATIYEYDDNGNIIKTIYADGSSVKSEYDARNRVIKQTDQNNNTTRYEYDGADRIAKVIDAYGNSYSYTYSNDKLITVKDALNNVTTYTYDAVGRVRTVTNAVGKTMEYTYDVMGNVILYKDYAGNITENIYDDCDRLVQKKVNGDITSFVYDEYGLLVVVKAESGIVSFDYDEYHRLVEKTDENGIKISYTYDDCGRISKLNNGFYDTSYEYDKMDRIIRVIDHNGQATVYEYDAVGNRSAIKYANGVTVTYTYDVCHRLKEECVTGASGEQLAKYSYGIGKAGECISITEIDEDNNKIEIIYTYDRLSRLKKETIKKNSSTLTNEYTYDAVSNRISKTTTIEGDISEIITEDIVGVNVIEGTTTYVYNALNQLISENTPFENILYTYDDNGNLIKQTGNDIRVFRYDAENRLLDVNISSGNILITESYTYDYAGNRMSKTENDNDTVYYVNDTSDSLNYVIAQTDKDGNLLTSYVRGDEFITAEKQDGTTNVFIYDGHGSVRMILDETANVTDRYSYDAYGSLLVKEGNTENEFFYNSEQYSENTGLYYLRTRYMNPNTGIFISMDSYQGNLYEPITLHKYLYANANPINYADPSGYLAEAIIKVNYDSAILAIGMKFISMARALVTAENLISLTMSALVTYELSVLVRDAIDMTGMEILENIFAISLPWSKTKEDEKTDVVALTEEERKNGGIYYHATSVDKAATISVSGILIGSTKEGGYVFAWKLKPNKTALKLSGAYGAEVILKFYTRAAFEPDIGIVIPGVTKFIPVRSVFQGPISIRVLHTYVV